MICNCFFFALFPQSYKIFSINSQKVMLFSLPIVIYSIP